MGHFHIEIDDLSLKSEIFVSIFGENNSKSEILTWSRDSISRTIINMELISRIGNVKTKDAVIEIISRLLYRILNHHNLQSL